MIPKYKKYQIVRFQTGVQEEQGLICIVDRNGIFANNREVFYDIYIPEQNALGKHVPETNIISVVEDWTTDEYFYYQIHIPNGAAPSSITSDAILLGETSQIKDYQKSGHNITKIELAPVKVFEKIEIDYPDVTDYSYENIWECIYEISFKNLRADLVYFKTIDGTYKRAYQTHIKSPAIVPDELKISLCLTERKGFINKDGSIKTWASPVINSMDENDEFASLYNIFYIIDMQFETIEIMNEDIREPKFINLKFFFDCIFGDG